MLKSKIKKFIFNARMRLLQVIINFNLLSSAQTKYLLNQKLAGQKIYLYMIEQYSKLTSSVAMLGVLPESIADSEIEKSSSFQHHQMSTYTIQNPDYSCYLLMNPYAIIFNTSTISQLLSLHESTNAPYTVLVSETSKECIGFLINSSIFSVLGDQIESSFENVYQLLHKTVPGHIIAVPELDCLLFNHVDKLATLQDIIKRFLLNELVTGAVIFEDINNCSIERSVKIGSNTHIGTGVVLQGNTVIGQNVIIEPFCIINNSYIKDRSHIKSHTVLRNVTIDAQSIIGPFAHLHQNSFIGASSIVGNYVEVKESTIGLYTKAKHLTYIGNAHIGNHVNVGAGTITCNHDGFQHNSTTIQDHAYIGSNTSLIAPVTIGSHAFVAAGSVITHNVPEQSLAIARAPQINKIGYAIKLRKKKNSAYTPPLSNKNEKNSEI